MMMNGRERWLTAFACACAATLDACGGAAAPRPAPNTAGRSPVAVSECMRAHGVPNFPDPSMGSGGEGLSVTSTPGSSTVNINGIDFSGPAFEAAEKQCSFGPPQGGTISVPESRRKAMIETAECMRKHGVPNFPDPNFNDIHAVAVAPKQPGPSGAEQQAMRFCATGRLSAAAQ